MSSPRTTAVVTVSSPAPLIALGRPVRPRFIGTLANTGKVIVGPGHLRAEKPGSPRGTGTGAGSTTKNHWTCRWAVEDLPDPASSGGFYWLGDASGLDGTSGIAAGARQWSPSDGGPAWHSQFPFKPSVVSINHYLFGGEIVHHPRGVSMNSHYIEHMWLDFGKAYRQPFTWLIAAAVTNWDYRGQRHYLLDAGRSPSVNGIHDFSTGACMSPRDAPSEGLTGYRTMMAVNRTTLITRTRTGTHQAGRLPIGGTLHPKMYVGVYNGANSAVGVYTPSSRRLRKAHLDTGGEHRTYVLGRRQGIYSQRSAGSLIVFEMRFFARALDRDDLTQHYREMASDYHFAKYQRG